MLEKLQCCCSRVVILSCCMNCCCLMQKAHWNISYFSEQSSGFSAASFCCNWQLAGFTCVVSAFKPSVVSRPNSLSPLVLQKLYALRSEKCKFEMINCLTFSQRERVLFFWCNFRGCLLALRLCTARASIELRPNAEQREKCN